MATEPAEPAMNHFDYRNGVLHAEAVNLIELAEAVGTPFYCYSTAKISTGKSENKFGVPLDRARAVYARAAKLPGIRVTGVDMHIGSQIIDLVPLEAAFRLLAEFVQTLRADGHTISHIDFGGGLGIPYHADREAPPAPAAYAAMVKRVTHNLGCPLMVEPGRMIVGNAGILVTRGIYLKHGNPRNFFIINPAMTNLI